MSYGQSNIIFLLINIFTYISVILELVCEILDLNLGKIQLQLAGLYEYRKQPITVTVAVSMLFTLRLQVMNTENNCKIIENNIFRLYTAFYRYKILLYICTYVSGSYTHSLKMKK